MTCETTMDCRIGFPCTGSGLAAPPRLCLPDGARHCQPCSKDTDCQLVGAGGEAFAACVDTGGGIDRCGVPCGAGCPDEPPGLSCRQVTSVSGDAVERCFLAAEDVCHCNSTSTSLALPG